MTADKGKKFGGGGMAESKKAMEQRHARTLSKLAKEEAAEAKEYKKGGAVFRKAADGIAKKGKTKGTQIAMRKGGKC
jgi:hypothetical protein